MEVSLLGKLKQLGGGDLIHAWDLVSAYHTSQDSVHDAKFIKYTLEVDKNKNFRNLPVELEPKPFFGQVRKFIVLTVSAQFPMQQGTGEEECVHSAHEQTIVLAAVAEAILTRKNAVGMVYFDVKSSDLGAATEVIDASTIDCLAGHILDTKRWACLICPAVAAKFKLMDESGGSNQ
ncbi:hypothetical protein B0H17DRAFT_1124551 [Mycena rosella]|uniref:Uncharacterized protein n=1 Tax=Mycena rosella TaxID=1033263 RepID=A0AAD7GZA5_MYCRO|nr:hypothetical protein B0H17DRAFT_1124551 [Mycena rosella]